MYLPFTALVFTVDSFVNYGFVHCVSVRVFFYFFSSCFDKSLSNIDLYQNYTLQDYTTNTRAYGIYINVFSCIIEDYRSII